MGVCARWRRCTGVHLLQHLLVPARRSGYVVSGRHPLVDRVQALGLGKGRDFVIRRETLQRILQRRLASGKRSQWQSTGWRQSLQLQHRLRFLTENGCGSGAISCLSTANAINMSLTVARRIHAPFFQWPGFCCE